MENALRIFFTGSVDASERIGRSKNRESVAGCFTHRLHFGVMLLHPSVDGVEANGDTLMSMQAVECMHYLSITHAAFGVQAQYRVKHPRWFWRAARAPMSCRAEKTGRGIYDFHLFSLT